MPARLLAALVAALAAGCTFAGTPPVSRDVAACVELFQEYDRAVWMYPNATYEGGNVPGAPFLRPIEMIRRGDCITRPEDIDGLPELAARLAPYRIVDSGPAIRPTAVQVGVVEGFRDERHATEFFRGLGYRSRGLGAAGLGRRLYIGPFTSQGALDQAIGLASEAGFVAPYAARYTRF